MDKTKAKLAATNLAAFFDNDDDESSFSQKTVDDAKLSQYLTAGTVRKSRREKEQDAAEAKKREEEASAAKAYAEFLDAFDTDDTARKSGLNFVKADSKSAYIPVSKNISEGSSSRHGKARTPSPVQASAPKPKGKRAMDAFLEEIKRDQAEREAKFSRSSTGRSVTALAAYEGQSGSKDRGDPQTSNIFVANLPPHVTEQSLGVFFARCGPVGSVKIMWPRTDGTAGPGADMTSSRRTKSSGLSGFVSFMKRKDAEQALRELDGFEWGGSVLRVGCQIKQLLQLTSAESQGITAIPPGARPVHGTAAAPRRLGAAPTADLDVEMPREVGRPVSATYATKKRRWSQTPSFAPSRAEIKGHGTKYEQNLRERERNNPKFAFMLRKDHRRHAFYRGLIESELPLGPEFDDDGYNSVYSSDSAEDSERERVRKNVLGKLARKRFEAMLRALSGKRGEMARCMAFSLEHAEAAHEVAEIIVASLLVDGTPVPRKVARLHLICDILHNSAASVPSAWKFRQEFQARLGVVFDHLANIYHSFPGRITAETFKKQITAIVDLWEDWIVFPPDFTAELRTRLEGMVVEEEAHRSEQKVEVVKENTEVAPSRFKTSTFQLATHPVDSVSPAAADDLDGEVMEDVDGEPVDDVDGEPMNDVDGEPIDDDVDGVPMDDVDGAPIDDDLDGAPMDEDLDGAPMNM
ncbi:SR140 protein [Mycena rebaudengoi]|nr:SR140 protein [Mycena rebaudengoi]